jgi:hypothetical protein
MQKHLSKLGAVLMALTGLVCWGTLSAAAAPGTSAPNVAQVDLVDDWACPVGSSPTTIPDLRLSITTSGGPLMVGLTLNIQNPLTQIEADALITPLIDGGPRTDEMLRFQIPHGEDRAGFGVFAFSRVYLVPAGTHTVSWEAACLSQLTVLRGWLTVYEVPPMKK